MDNNNHQEIILTLEDNVIRLPGVGDKISKSLISKGLKACNDVYQVFLTSGDLAEFQEKMKKIARKCSTFNAKKMFEALKRIHKVPAQNHGYDNVAINANYITGSIGNREWSNGRGSMVSIRTENYVINNHTTIESIEKKSIDFSGDDPKISLDVLEKVIDTSAGKENGHTSRGRSWYENTKMDVNAVVSLLAILCRNKYIVAVLILMIIALISRFTNIDIRVLVELPGDPKKSICVWLSISQQLFVKYKRNVLHRRNGKLT